MSGSRGDRSRFRGAATSHSTTPAAAGRQARWNRNGRELFTRDPDNYRVSVEVAESGAGFQTGAVRKLLQFHGSSGLWPYDVSPDGSRFLVTVPLEKNLASPVTLMTDWTRKTEGRQGGPPSRSLATIAVR